MSFDQRIMTTVKFESDPGKVLDQEIVIILGMKSTGCVKAS